MTLRWRWLIWRSKRAHIADMCWRYNMLLPYPRICWLSLGRGEGGV